MMKPYPRNHTLEKLRYIFWPWGIIKRLRKALDIATDSSFYPVSVTGGEHPYKERNDYMNGWNDAAMRPIERICDDNVLLDGDWE